MPKLKEILDEDQRRAREAEEARRAREEAEKERQIKDYSLFVENLQPFLRYLAEHPEIFKVIEDLQALIRSRKDIPKIERLVIFTRKIQLPVPTARPSYAFDWALFGQEDTEKDKRSPEWWKDLSEPKGWYHSYYTMGTPPIRAVGLRVNYGHHVHQDEFSVTEDWNQFVDVFAQKSSLGQGLKLIARSGNLGTGFRIGSVAQEIEAVDPSSLDETVADIYLKSLQPQKGKV